MLLTFKIDANNFWKTSQAWIKANTIIKRKYVRMWAFYDDGKST